MQVLFHRKGIDVSGQERERIARRLEGAAGRLADRVGRVDVHLEDQNGPKGGVDKWCTLVVRLKPKGTFVLSRRGDAVPALVERVAERLGHRLAERLGRRRGRRAVQLN